MFNWNTIFRIRNDVEPVLIRQQNVRVSNEGNAFGIVQKKPSNGLLDRNWVTYLRLIISDVERQSTISKTEIKYRIQETFGSEVHMGFVRKTKAITYCALRKLLHGRPCFARGISMGICQWGLSLQANWYFQPHVKSTLKWPGRHLTGASSWCVCQEIRLAFDLAVSPDRFRFSSRVFSMGSFFKSYPTIPTLFFQKNKIAS